MSMRVNPRTAARRAGIARQLLLDPGIASREAVNFALVCFFVAHAMFLLFLIVACYPVPYSSAAHVRCRCQQG
jgi:hypothetical protein